MRMRVVMPVLVLPQFNACFLHMSVSQRHHAKGSGTGTLPKQHRVVMLRLQQGTLRMCKTINSAQGAARIALCTYKLKQIQSVATISMMLMVCNIPASITCGAASVHNVNTGMQGQCDGGQGQSRYCTSEVNGR